MQYHINASYKADEMNVCILPSYRQHFSLKTFNNNSSNTMNSTENRSNENM